MRTDHNETAGTDDNKQPEETPIEPPGQVREQEAKLSLG